MKNLLGFCKLYFIPILKFLNQLGLFFNVAWGRQTQVHFLPYGYVVDPELYFERTLFLRSLQCSVTFVINQVTVCVGLFLDSSGFGKLSIHILITDCLSYYSHRSWYLQFCCSSILPCLFLALCFHMIFRIRFLIWGAIFFNFNWDCIEFIGEFMDTCHLYNSLGV